MQDLRICGDAAGTTEKRDLKTRVLCRVGYIEGNGGSQCDGRRKKNYGDPILLSRMNEGEFKS